MSHAGNEAPAAFRMVDAVPPGAMVVLAADEDCNRE